MTNHLNLLNLSLQGRKYSIYHSTEHVEGSRSKSALLTDRSNNNLAQFRCCSVIKKEYSNADFAKFVRNITLLFEDFHKLKILLRYTTTPCKRLYQPTRKQLKIQLELCKL